MSGGPANVPSRCASGLWVERWLPLPQNLQLTRVLCRCSVEGHTLCMREAEVRHGQQQQSGWQRGQDRAGAAASPRGTWDPGRAPPRRSPPPRGTHYLFGAHGGRRDSVAAITPTGNRVERFRDRCGNWPCPVGTQPVGSDRARNPLLCGHPAHVAVWSGRHHRKHSDARSRLWPCHYAPPAFARSRRDAHDSAHSGTRQRRSGRVLAGNAVSGRRRQGPGEGHLCGPERGRAGRFLRQRPHCGADRPLFRRFL